MKQSERANIAWFLAYGELNHIPFSEGVDTDEYLKYIIRWCIHRFYFRRLHKFKTVEAVFRWFNRYYPMDAPTVIATLAQPEFGYKFR